MKLQNIFGALKCTVASVAAAAAVLAPVSSAHAQTTPRTAFVHLFEWKWTDIAKECETFLGPKGYAAVQVSPPNEHALVKTGDGAPYPWWMRYQPVSYELNSRSGTVAQFQDMIRRCNAVGVGIYVDAVINHMTGADSGTTANGTSITGSKWTYHNFPKVPYGENDFHAPRCVIRPEDYTTDAWRVQNCDLSNLQDLNTGAPYVRGKIADYLVGLVNMGVAGFRVDAAKHMSPADLGAIVDAVNARVAPKKPYWFLEVIGGGSNEKVQPSQYYGLNNNTMNITEFAFGPKLYGKFTGEGGGKLADLQTFGESWGLMPSAKAVSFTDNHDKQRNHGGGGQYMTYHFGSTYTLANIFQLAWPYGYPSIMSSYAFNKVTDYDTSYGPPFNAADGSTRGPWDGQTTNPACFNQNIGGWVCEHRYRPIANMVGFRNATLANWTVTNWWSNGNNQIAFGRGNLGFVAINKEGGVLNRTFSTSLPAGRYCDVINGDLVNGACTGDTYTVDASGSVNLVVGAYDAVAIHAGSRLSTVTPPPATSNVVFTVQGAAPAVGQNVYVSGNVAALGAWDPCKAVLMTANNGAFSTTVSLPANTAVQFKFMKYSTCSSATWEAGSNRTITTPSTGTASRCAVFGSTAACTTTPPPPTTNITVTFNATADTNLGQSIALVGSVTALGAWAPAQSVNMTVVPGSCVGTRCRWTGSASLPSRSSVEYKYIKKDTNGTVFWESGANRVVNTGTAASSTNDTWK